MKLWTFQSPDFSLMNDRSDWSHSIHFKNRCPETWHILKGYRTISTRLGTDQWIWCHTQEQPQTCKLHSSDGHPMIRHDLDVPNDWILCFINENAWQSLIHRVVAKGSGPMLRSHWKKEAKLRDLKLRDYLFTILFLESPVELNDSAIVPLPVKPEWILKSHENIEQK